MGIPAFDIDAVNAVALETDIERALVVLVLALYRNLSAMQGEQTHLTQLVDHHLQFQVYPSAVLKVEVCLDLLEKLARNAKLFEILGEETLAQASAQSTRTVDRFGIPLILSS